MGFVLFLDMNIRAKLYGKQLYSAARITKRKLMEHANVSLTVLNKLINYNLFAIIIVYMKVYVALQNGLIDRNSTTTRRNSSVDID